MPSELDKLLDLPYVGRYAANAVLCFAYGVRVPVVDSNVARVYSRVFDITPGAKRLSSAHALWDFAREVLPRKRIKEYNWALLDLGGTVCRARKPLCSECPVARICAFHSADRVVA